MSSKMRVVKHAKRFMVVLAALGLIFIYGCGIGDDTVPELLQKAKIKESEGDFRASMIFFKDALSKDPKNVEGRWLLGNLYVRLGFGVEAEKELRIAKDLGVSADAVIIPLAWSLLQQQRASVLLSETERMTGLAVRDRSTLMMLRGRAFLLLPVKDANGAKNAFRKSREIDPGSASALVSSALIEIMEDRSEQAAGYLEQATRVAGDDVDAWVLLGDVRFSLKYFEKAEAAYSKAISISGINMGASYKRALTRVQLKKYVEARGDVETAKRLGLQSMMYYFVSGVIDIAQDRFDDAQTHLEEARRQDDRYLPTYYYLGLTHLSLNHLALADEAVGKYLSVFPESAEALSLKARIYLLRKNYVDALSIADKLLERTPNDVLMLAVCGQSALMVGQAELSVKCFEDLVKIDPSKPQYMASLGTSQIAAGSVDNGLDTLGAAARIAPKDRGLALSYIVNLLMQGRYSQALEQVRALSPGEVGDDLVVMQLEAKALLGLKDIAGARAVLDHSLKISPGNPASLIAMAKIDVMEGKVDSAVDRYREILKYHPDNAEALLQLAEIESKKMRFVQAKVLLERAVDNNPEASEARVALANLYLVTGSANNVIRVLEPLRKFFDQSPELLRLIGLARLQGGDVVSAARAFERRVQLQPGSASAHYDLAKAYMANGDGRGLSELNKASELNSAFLPAKVAKIRYLQMRGDHAIAQAEMDGLRNTAPNDPEVLAQAAWLAMQQRRYGEAVDLYRKAVGTLPSAELVLELAEALNLNNDRPEAIKALKAWTEYGNNDRRVWFALARTYEVMNEYENAKAAYMKMLESDQNDVPAINNLAMLLRKSNPVQALNYAERAYGIAPNLVNAADTYAVLLMDRKEYERSVRILAAVKAEASPLPQVRLHLAEALVGIKEFVGARRVLLGLIKDFSSSPEREEAEKMLSLLGQ